MIKQIIELVEVNYDISFINYNAVSQCSNKILYEIRSYEWLLEI